MDVPVSSSRYTGHWMVSTNADVPNGAPVDPHIPNRTVVICREWRAAGMKVALEEWKVLGWLGKRFVSSLVVDLPVLVVMVALEP